MKDLHFLQYEQVSSLLQGLTLEFSDLDVIISQMLCLNSSSVWELLEYSFKFPHR
jgi:hypothetical protein